jgi:hypothetical protein
VKEAPISFGWKRTERDINFEIEEFKISFKYHCLEISTAFEQVLDQIF